MGRFALLSLWLASTLAAQPPAPLDRDGFVAAFRARFSAVEAGDPAEDARPADKRLVALVTANSWHAVPVAVLWIHDRARRSGPSESADSPRERARVIAAILEREANAPGLRRLLERSGRWTAEEWKKLAAADGDFRNAQRLRSKLRWSEARSLYQRCARVYRSLGHGYRETVVSIQLAACLRSERRRDAALSVAERSVRLARTFGDARLIALAEVGLGASLRGLGRAREARAAFANAAALPDHVLGRRNTAAVLQNLALLDSNAGRLSEAAAAHDRIVRLVRPTGDPAQLAVALDGAAQVAARQSRLDDAIRDHTEALTHWRALDRPVQIARGLFRIGVAHLDRGDPDTALDFLGRALAKGARANASPLPAQIRAAQALAHADRGEPRRGLASANRAASLLRAKTRGDGRARAWVHARLGKFFVHRQRYGRALDHHRRALTIQEATGATYAAATSRLNLGVVRFRLGEFAAARDRFREALGVLRNSSRCRMNLACTYAAMGRTADAIEQLDAIRRLPDHRRIPGQATLVASNLGRLHLIARNAEAARTWLTKALRARRAERDPVDIARCLLDFAALNVLERDLDAAITTYEEALELLDGQPQYESRARAHHGLGYVLALQGRHEAALDAYESASEWLERARPASRRAGDAARLSFARENLPWLPALATHAAASVVAESYEEPAAVAYSILERVAGASMRDLLVESAITARGDGDPFAAQRRELASIAATARAATGRDRMDALGSLRRARRDLEARIRADDPDYASLVYPRASDADSIRAALPDGEVLIAYVFGLESAYAFVVSRDAIRLRRLGPVDAVRRRLELWLEELADPSSTAHGGHADALSKWLIHPLEDWLESATGITVIPHQQLCFAPFDALRTRDGRLVLDRWPVRYVHSGTVLRALAERANRRGDSTNRKTLLALGDPVPAKSTGVPRLPGTAAEVRAIAEIAGAKPRDIPDARDVSLDGDVCIRLGSAAVAGALAGLGDVSFRAIHLACHGRAHRDAALSGLVLSPSTGGTDDGFVDLHDLFGLRWRADVVVVSACDGNVGEVVGFEGVQSLTRALLFAGASTAIVANWKAADATTPGLMADFYRHWLRDGHSPRESLRRAKRALRERNPHPFYWATFAIWGRGES